LGETDVLKNIQMLPGVQSGAEGSSGFHVRGGSPDQNLILLDGVPVYNVNHFFGFFLPSIRMPFQMLISTKILFPLVLVDVYLQWLI
jgi:hypothetical protein